jgi:hypothetical protein
MPASLVNNATWKNIAPKIGFRVPTKAYLHVDFGRLITQLVKHGECVVEDWAGALDTIVDILSTVLGFVD